ncbi:MAG: Gx transporter family protein [Firmicutes bacterium]|nr:Gx transporter family protein [Bacillota bacterium]
MSTRKLTRSALLFALSIALAYLEHLLPPLPFLPPGVKLGLSNIITMYALFFIGPAQAVLISLLKGGFVLITRGAIAGCLSLMGGLFSVLVMALLAKVRIPDKSAAEAKESAPLSYLFISICGAVCHNLGQLIGVYFLISHSFLAYVPVLLVSGVLMGSITGVMLRLLLPAIDWADRAVSDSKKQ